MNFDLWVRRRRCIHKLVLARACISRAEGVFKVVSWARPGREQLNGYLVTWICPTLIS